jgi:Fic-DOC domain mobile mystery protein B
MGLEFGYIYGQTPLEEEEKEGLLLDHITKRSELDEFEQQNIEKAVEWIMERKFTVERVLSEGFVLELHNKMFGNVWSWAGKYRKTDKNIGIDKFLISAEVFKLNEDCKFWIENKTYTNDEIAIRYKHRIVKIHPFANGNGRHSRLMADVIIEKVLDGQIFSWGHENLVKMSIKRKQYIDSIIDADNGNILPLILFARS